MAPERFRQIEELYHRALECPPEERDAFLTAVCQGDDDLKRQLGLLLAKDASADKFLDHPAADLLPRLVSNAVSLAAGTQLGPYRIEGILGRGGMGQVYRGRDPRLGRAVAIKVSTGKFSRPCEQEARAIATLNHPHVCTLYDVGPDYLVMELVEGATLEERIAGGPLSVEEALAYALQVAEALAYSHDKGVVHRDLKPANVKITPEGSVKVLDFGLAKIRTEERATAAATGTTLTTQATQPGVIVGTAAYMAPEQARGEGIDKRADIWAFGVVLYEMLTGHRPFQGNTFTDTLAAVLTAEPDWKRVPFRAQRLLRACLEKNPRERLREIGDARLLLEELPESAAVAPRRFWWITGGVAAVCILCGWAIAHRPAGEIGVESPALRYTIPPPENNTYRPGRVSPDGRWFAFIAVDGSGKSQLWVRRLDSLNAQPLAVAEHWPFWSPDSRFIAFEQNGKLNKIEATGGTPQILCDTPLVIGGSWNRAGTIVFSDGDSILAVSEKGGEAKPVTRLNAEELGQDYPAFLPDGRHFLYQTHSSRPERAGIYIGSLDSADDGVRLLPDMSNAEYAFLSPQSRDSGYVLFARGTAIMAQRLQAGSHQLQGEAFRVAENVYRSSNGARSFSASENGILITGPTYLGDKLTWFDRKGNRLGTIGPASLHLGLQLSPDDQTVLVDQADEGFISHLWFLQAGGKGASRITFRWSARPLWSADGSRIAFVDMSSGVYMRTVAGSGDEELVLPPMKLYRGGMSPDDYRLPCDLSKDGRFLIYTERGERTRWNLWILPLFGDRTPRQFLAGDYNQRCGALSPDGRWLAYESDEARGRPEIYVQALSEKSALPGKWQVSYNGGTWPKWSGDGKELFFLDAGRNVTVAAVKPGGTFQTEPPQQLFASHIMTPDSRFDVSHDGRRFLIPAETDAGSAPATVVVNWIRSIRP